MGVYVKDFKMPTSCEDCWIDENICDLWEDIDLYDRDIMRHKDCPLVEVKTPHGDLVDHEALGEILLQMRNDDTLTFVEDDEFRKNLLDDVMRETWNGLRTIIEAEGE